MEENICSEGGYVRLEASVSERGVKGLGRGNETGGVSGLKVPCALAAGDDGGRARGGVRRGEGDLSERGLPSSSGGSGCIPRFGGGG